MMKIWERRRRNTAGSCQAAPHPHMPHTRHSKNLRDFKIFICITPFISYFVYVYLLMWCSFLEILLNFCVVIFFAGSLDTLFSCHVLDQKWLWGWQVIMNEPEPESVIKIVNLNFIAVMSSSGQGRETGETWTRGPSYFKINYWALENNWQWKFFTDTFSHGWVALA